MKNFHVLTFVLVFLLAACGKTNIKADVPDTPEAEASQVLLEQYITALTTYDSTHLDSLLSDDYQLFNYARFIRPDSKGDLIYSLAEDMSTRSYKVENISYTLTIDGRFAVLQYTYSEVSPFTGKWTSTPLYDVMEFRNGQIVQQSWYYNDENLH